MDESLTIDLHNRQQAWQAIKTQVFPFLAQVLQVTTKADTIEQLSKGRR